MNEGMRRKTRGRRFRVAEKLLQKISSHRAARLNFCAILLLTLATSFLRYDAINKIYVTNFWRRLN